MLFPVPAVLISLSMFPGVETARQGRAQAFIVLKVSSSSWDWEFGVSVGKARARPSELHGGSAPAPWLRLLGAAGAC